MDLWCDELALTVETVVAELSMMDESFLKSLLSPVVPDEVTAVFDARLNAQRMLMSIRTGKVQRLELWQQRKGADASASRIDSDLVEVKRLDGHWVRVN